MEIDVLSCWCVKKEKSKMVDACISVIITRTIGCMRNYIEEHVVKIDVTISIIVIVINYTQY